ncbi:ATPase family AAA domain-containing protein 5 [Alligator sinensis]|uniref:ATPase family AAA domain-containing protein 5 n=1 Tax=Alligator sinensis TaxID=38654 RepID=A0A3Q0FXM6_ALLSI|nr:ATPase family AAA domain-containing protein 5 [Alligator sinensis]
MYRSFSLRRDKSPHCSKTVGPCKKRREEDPPIKTITKYFSPLAKNVDKVLSPPKSNNILDYFKKTPLTNEKIALPVASGENKISPAEQLGAGSKDSKSTLKTSSKLKRKGKRVNLNNKLKEMQIPDNECVIEITSDDSRETIEPKEDCLEADIVASSSSTSLVQKCVEGPAEDKQQSKVSPNAVTCRKDAKKTGSELNGTKNKLKRSRKRKHKDGSDLSKSFSSENQLNEKSTKECQDKKQILHLKTIESQNTLSDLSLETNVEEASQLTDGTITVSFEDFLKSQEENMDHIQEAKMPTFDSTVTTDEMDKSDSTSDPENCKGSQQLPLRTVTVLAQVHPIPPKSASLLKEKKASRKIASIFLKHKGSEIEKESSPDILEIEQTDQISQKRKSNVVIEEEELELAVLEAVGPEAAKPKCTVEERHQFMKAFKQPVSDVVKSGVKKIPGKVKEINEKSSKQKQGIEEGEAVSNKSLESEIPKDYADKHSHGHTENGSIPKERTNKLKRKKKKILETKGTNILIPNSISHNEDESIKDNVQIKKTSSDSIIILSSPKKKKLRRSVRQKTVETSKNITPEKCRLRDALSEDALGDGPLQASTPKASNRKKNIYKAEVITVPYDAKSPIRMRFTRIGASKKSNKTEAREHEEFIPSSIKVNSTSKNISKAKQLIEKAKAIQHHRSKVNEDMQTPVRRSSRQQALAERRKLQGSEDSVIILTSTPGNKTAVTQHVEKKQKKLRNLNDVLGRKFGSVKIMKKNGKPSVPPSFLGKKAQNCGDEPIVIFDESSRDVSENSQDDEQFKAKREFLMSGLPESLKRYIAKKAAAMEAYSVASSSFQTVVHVQQKDDCSLLWRLTSPLCPLLAKLREPNTNVTDVTKLTVSLGEFSVISSKPSSNNSSLMLSGWRPVFPKNQRNCLLEEIKSSNLEFPARLYFNQFLKKQTERVLSESNKQVNKCEATHSEMDQISSDNPKEAKRKRKETEDCKSKRRKQIDRGEVELKSKTSKNEVSCTKQTDTEKVTHAGKNRTQDSDVITIEDIDLGSELNPVSGIEKEDVLWTEKYQPQESSELVGNAKTIKRLHGWLQEWKRRADLEEKRNQKVEKDEGNAQQDSLDSMDFKEDKSDSEEEIALCNTMLITGPPGVGKTAAVYACAQELGFKIFEVNASCQRSGRQILSQLKEATQSHQVDKQGVNAHKPCFFNSCSTKSPKKINSPKKIVSPRKPPLSPKGTGIKRSFPPKTLANYFKVSSKPKNNEETVKSQEKNKETIQKSPEETADIQIRSVSKEVGGEELNRKSATSLILFEEVDIIFDEDAGFLSAIKTFMATAKRPIILTTNDPTFSLMFDGYFEEINFKIPPLINAASYLQVLCLAENLRTDIKDLATLLTTNNCDIRQSVLYLQFWIRSGGGCLKEKGVALHGRGGGRETNGSDQLTLTEKTDSKSGAPQTDIHLQKLPKCDTGCIETLLGLKNIFLPSEDLFTFLKHKITTTEDWNKLIKLLLEFQMKKVDFIYSNLESILPLPVQILPKPTQTFNPLFEKATAVSSNERSLDQLEKASPVKKSKRTKNQRRLALLDDSDLFDNELNYSAEFISLSSDGPKSCLEKNPDELKFRMNKEEKVKIPARKKSSALVSNCLHSLTEFVDDMSFLDCCLRTNVREPKEYCRNEGFNWTHGKIKNGLCDEHSTEDSDWWSFQSCSELKAAVEALSFNKCFVNISQDVEASLNPKTLGSDQMEELTLRISEERNNIYFGQSADSSIHRKAEKRLEIIQTVFSSRTLLHLCNRQASIVEYLPTLRSICRSEKLKEQGKLKRRFLHYLEGIHLEIPKETMSSLAAEFP